MNFDDFDFNGFYDYVVNYMESESVCEYVSTQFGTSESKSILGCFLQIKLISDSDIKKVSTIMKAMTLPDQEMHPNIERFCRYIGGESVSWV